MNCSLSWKQGGATLAVALKTKDQKIKSMAVPSALSACMGITEPAIFGVNLRFGKPFVMGCIGGAFGALFASVTGLGATGTGVTGIFGILLCLKNPGKRSCKRAGRISESDNREIYCVCRAKSCWRK